jgi:hypothetical protein
MKAITLLLTGTVFPGEMAFTKLIDPEIRKSHYISSLNYWLEETDLPIVFVENSGTDLSKSINPRHRGRIELLTFNGNTYSKRFGKGYGELKCLHYAAVHSEFLKHSEFIFKITGRYKVQNFRKFESFYQQHKEMYIFLDFKGSLTFADSRLFGFNPEFVVKYLVKRQEEANDSSGHFFENVLARATLEAIIDGKTFMQLPYYPKLIGISGTDNKPYKSNFLFFLVKRIKYYFKSRFMSGY